MSYDGGQWQYPEQAAPPGRPLGAGMAITALVLGILAVLLSWAIIGGIVLGLVAIVLGVVAARRARRGLAGGRGMAIAGVVLGIVGLLINVGLIGLSVSLLNSSDFKSFRQCMQDANGDRAKIQHCQAEFKRNVQNGNG
jgi:hypothetical protein